MGRGGTRVGARSSCHLCGQAAGSGKARRLTLANPCEECRKPICDHHARYVSSSDGQGRTLCTRCTKLEPEESQRSAIALRT